MRGRGYNPRRIKSCVYMDAKGSTPGHGSKQMHGICRVEAGASAAENWMVAFDLTTSNASAQSHAPISATVRQDSRFQENSSQAKVCFQDTGIEQSLRESVAVNSPLASLGLFAVHRTSELLINIGTTISQVKGKWASMRSSAIEPQRTTQVPDTIVQWGGSTDTIHIRKIQRPPRSASVPQLETSTKQSPKQDQHHIQALRQWTDYKLIALHDSRKRMEAAQDQLAHFNRVLQRLHQADKDKLDLAIELSEARMQQDLAESEAEEYRQVLETFIALRAELESTLEMRDRQLSHATSSLMDNSGVIADLQQKLCMMEQRALAAESRAQSAEMTAANQSESMEHGRGSLHQCGQGVSLPVVQEHALLHGHPTQSQPRTANNTNPSESM